MFSASPSSAPYKNPLSVRVEKGIIAMFVLMGIIILVLLGFYISYHNKNATLGYKLRLLQSERADILAENEALSMKIASLSTIERLQESIEKSQMVATTDPVYVRGNTAVAKGD